MSDGKDEINPLDILRRLMEMGAGGGNTVFHIDIIADTNSVQIGVRKDNEAYDALTPAGREMMDKVLDAMVEAGKGYLNSSGVCGQSQTLVDKRPFVASSDDGDNDFFDRVKVIDDDN